ncbi:serine/threonine-protein kinase LMTK2-like isoform X3 [Sinocyclocheilus rhinocerous]|uniref:serine/threonine-protein kinase LMTK2-like isoform X2 n=1 Tax=Sinocyclocheilus rhinocerous TaxID=307959 RepID=UPI0007B89B64|nr:PREDICTED: serine/threonine-protein kinase LMTK2-like isoform X2 [Sinocyclocheilus rhinocerous]XP_016375111.1 PREDICTED: serine/threonine-protein kinase LMTK2-like isoform X3 [Sinocyclocheilus rhinocerous]
MEALRGGVCLLGFASLTQAAPVSNTHAEAAGYVDFSLIIPLLLSLAVSVALVVLLLNCASCCKEQEINFKEFEDHFEDEVDFTPPAEDTPSTQSPAEVYTLAVPPVPLPGPPHLQLPRITDVSSGPRVARHSLSYIQEIGNGWFGKVLLSEIYVDPGVAQAVVKELKANTSSKEQNEFLQQGDLYRVLQHPNILQCLGQCVEAIPFLLVFEYCELGDLKSYISQHEWLYRNGELLQLQKMACEIAAGVTHMHKHNFLHSDLALRNCYLTTDLTVKVGDYGIGPSSFKEDYITTEDDQCVALRWLAPELIGELHGGVITSEQTKPSNVWALGVTLWELFEGAKQPYPHLSDREVLHHVLKDQQVRLLKPQLDLPYSERWYEVLQFCWLPADKRATAEEVHRLLTYLRMQGQKDVEDDFEQRWSSLKPNPTTRQATVSHSSFPILEQFDDGREPDEVLTVTETSRGLSFEYVWEAAKHDHYDSHNRSAMDTTLNYHSMFFPVPRQDIQANFPDTVAQAENGRVPETLPVFDAHKASSGNDYFIKLEELDESDIGMGESQGAEGTNASEQHQYVVLQDVRLDESSADADFFHQSIDSKDSFLQDSHIWSSSEHESPYHTNIFSEGDAKLEDSHSFTGGFMELPEMNVPKRDSDGGANGKESSDSFQKSFLGVGPEAIHLEISDQESSDVMKLLNTEKLTENFLFLKDNTLLKDKSQFESKNIQETMSSVTETDVSDSVNLTGESLKSAGNSAQLKDELLDLVSPILDDFLSPLKGNETMVPFDILVTGQTCSNHLPDTNGSLRSPKSGNYSSSDSTSESVEVIVDSPSDSHQSLESATTDTQHMCIDAKPPSLEECFEASKENGQYRGISDAAELSFTTSPAGECTEGGFTEALTSSDSMSDIMELDKKAVNDIPPSEAIDQDQETLLDNLETQDMSSLLVSDVCLDQISQDSLLDDSTSSTLPTIENSAETPDSLDSLDVYKDVVHGQSLETPVNKLQPPYKAADSGYETENLESPEWNSQTSLRDSSEEKEMGSAEEPAALVPPEMIIFEVDTVPDVQVNGGRVDHQQEPVEVPLGGNYRDSAYFSDNEELDKKSDDISGSGPGDASFWLQSNREADESQGTEAVEEHSVSETSPESGDVQAVLPELVLTTEEDWSQEKPLTVDDSDQTHPHAAPEHAAKSTTSMQPSTDVMVHAKLTRTYAGEVTKKKKPDMEGRYLGKLDGSSLEYGTEDGMDADEEDENSDESDEDMRAYRLHSSSSECSEDDVMHPVPVIISDDSSSLNLKGLLKPKSLQTAKATLEEGSNGDNRRGVSFFDDVTVYLFDQETPTKELGEHTLDPSSQLSDFSSPVASSSYLNRFTNSESSTDEEGGAFEWDDDFSSPGPNFLSKAASDHSASRPGGTSAASKYFSPPPANRTLEQSWNSPSNYSRFSISPASIASFSLTHLTDSDIEQGGSGEDGEKD